MKHLWLDHCVQLASLLNTYMPRHHRDANELHERMQIKLSCKEFSQLRAELGGMQQFLRPDALQEPDKIYLLGVAFVPSSEEYIRELRLKIEALERGRIAVENIMGMGDRFVRSRRGVGRGVHVSQTHQPGTNRG